MPLPNRVVLDQSPFIHPLLELLDEGGPVGVVLASRGQARLLEWRLGELIPLQQLRAGVVEPRHERSGPVGSRPAARHGTPTGEQRNARERDYARRFIERTAAVASRMARDYHWQRILVSAGEQYTDPLVDALPPALREAAVRDPRVLVGLELAELEQVTTERIRAAHTGRERGLLRSLRERAQGAGAAALGLSEVVGALNQARVAHLIYDPLIRYRGSVADDGTLYAGDEGAPTYVGRPELRLTERMVERALETGARVTPVEGAASSGLSDASGIAAVLRW
jgi:Bacterial archaeo-eukaryotic release factor family 10